MVREGINGSTSSPDHSIPTISAVTITKSPLHSINVNKSSKLKSSSARKSSGGYPKIQSATCKITPSGVHISQLSSIKKDVPSKDKESPKNCKVTHEAKSAKPFHLTQKPEISSFQECAKKNGKINVESDNESDHFSSNAEEDMDSPCSIDSDVKKNSRDNIVPKLVIKGIKKSPTIPKPCDNLIDDIVSNQDNAPLDLCVKPVQSSTSSPVPISIIKKHSLTTEPGPPSIKVLPIYSSEPPMPKTGTTLLTTEKIIGNSTDPLTITKISPKKITKQRCRKSTNVSASEKLKEERRRKEELRNRLETELRQQNLQFKLAKQNAIEKEAARGKDGQNNNPKKRGRPPKIYTQQVPVPATKAIHIKPKIHTAIPSKSPHGISVKITSIPDQNSTLNSKVPEYKISPNLQSGSDSESDERDTDETGNSTDGGDKIDQSEPQNLSANSNSISNKRRILVAEREIRIPLEKGWKRRTTIRCFSQSGVRGEVVYFAPCGKKMKAYPEISRYLEKHSITNITRENFSFSSKYNIGQFLVPASGGGPNDYNLVSENEILKRLNEFRTKKGKSRRKRGRPPVLKGEEEPAPPKKLPKKEKESRRHAEEDEMARKRKRLEEERAMTLIKEAKRNQDSDSLIEYYKGYVTHSTVQLENMKRMKDQVEILKIQEEMAIQRKKQELKMQQMIDEREMKRQQALMLKEQEMQKQRELLMVLDLERERRRQHMVLVKAMENRKKQEERDMKREELRVERQLEKDRKLEQRRIEVHVLSEMKRPVDDMALKNQRQLPTYNRIPGVKLPGAAFGNILMVFEFLHNFGETLGFDVDSLPSLNTLQMALLNDEESEEELFHILQHLLTCALDDPGLPFYPKTILNQSIKDVTITSLNISEVLRLYFLANSGKDSEMYKWLQESPFFALNVPKKSEILGFFCNELVGSRVLARQVDIGLENVANFRKDKWIVEGEIRTFRTLQAKKHMKLIAQEKLNSANAAPTPTLNGVGESPKEKRTEEAPEKKNEDNNSEKKVSDKNEKKENEDISSSPAKVLENGDSTSNCLKDGEEDVAANESGNESDDNQEVVDQTVETDDDDSGITMEEIEKKVDKLGKQLKQARHKLQRAQYSVRAMSYGQDRFRRRYWVLPTAGGVYVESMESSEPPGGDTFYFPDPSNVKDEKCVDEVEEGKEIKNDVDNPEKIKTNVDNAEMTKTNVDDADKIKSDVGNEKLKTDVINTEKLKSDVNNAVKIKTEKFDSVKESSDQEESKKISDNDDISEGELVIDEKLPNDLEESKSHSGEMKAETSVSTKEKAADISDRNKPVERKLKNLKKEGIELKPFVDGTKVSPHTVKPNDKSSIDSITPFIDPNCFMNNSVDKDLNSAALLRMFGKFEPSLPNNSLNPFTTNFMNSAFAINAEQMIKNTIDATSTSAIADDAKPWFSLLPRIPCDDTSLTVNTSRTNETVSYPVTSSPAITSHPQFSTPTVTSSNNGFSAFQPNFSPMPVMNMMNGSNFLPPGIFNPGQFGSPFGSVYSPIMFPSLGYGIDPAAAAPSTNFYSPVPTVSPITVPSITSLATTVLDFEKMSEPLPDDLQAIVLERLNQSPKPKAISSEFSRGWWRITDQIQIRDLIKVLHSRGVRERVLYKMLDKYMEVAIESCLLGKQDEIGLNITDEDRGISEKMGGAPEIINDKELTIKSTIKAAVNVLEQVEGTEARVCSASMHTKSWRLPPRLSSDETLEMVFGHETDVEAICGSCIKKENLKSDSDNPKSDESKEQIVLENKEVKSSDGMKKNSPDLVSNEIEKGSEDPVEKMDVDEDKTSCKKVIADTTKDIETSGKGKQSEMEEKKDAKSEDSENKSASDDNVQIPRKKVCPILLTQEKLRNLEASIERRYLKPPLARPASQVNALVSYSEDDIPNGLNNWRMAVDKAETSSQLAMCLQMLEHCVAWDKSIMKASCQFCHSGDNEGMLLLCDNCDKGYHTYCFKPEMDKIPEGDWFCYECLNKANGDKLCCLCGNKGRQMITCDSCPKMFHLECLEINKKTVSNYKNLHSSKFAIRHTCDVRQDTCHYTYRVKMASSNARYDNVSDTLSSSSEISEDEIDLSSCEDYCEEIGGSGKCVEPYKFQPLKSVSEDRPSDTQIEDIYAQTNRTKRKYAKAKDKDKDKDVKETKEVKNSSEVEEVKQTKQSEKRKLNKLISLLNKVVSELENHDDAWPFLLPVNTKQFTTYKKIIKKPMDLSTVKTRLQDGQYKCKEDFIQDVTLIFDNCETFNEDDSPVGKAGHILRSFFTSCMIDVGVNQS
ncbi:Bromodomain adjacent to zinc finger domain protein 2B [Nymphon striatum]|nr:Bromodomain adjacent to zinc finger domain protein 2B [Nymphon striatum]